MKGLKLQRMMRDKYKTLFVISGLTIAVLAVFWQVHKFEFVNYDDNKYVSGNEHIFSGFTGNNLKWLFTSDVGRWHPLTGLTHMLDCELFGLNAGRHHLTNLLLHIANTLLLFAVFKRATGALWQSAFVAALFALHPLHVESVAWISGRKDVLSTLLWILTIGAYLRYTEKHSGRWYALALVLFVLGLMAKPMAVTLPFVLLLLDYWPLNRFETGHLDKGKHKEISCEWMPVLSLVLEKIPFFVITGVSCVITFFLFRSIGQVKSIEALPLAFRAGNAVISYTKYIEKTIWPVHLAVNYSYSTNVVPYWQVFAAAVLLLAVTILVIYPGGRYRYLSVGWFLYLGTLVPVIGLIQINDLPMADRYTYVPSIGLFIIVAWGTNDLIAHLKYRRIVLNVSSSVVILVLSVCTWFQTGYWHDSIGLFTHALKVTSGNCLAHNNRGVAYDGRGEYDLAISDFNKALEINPRFAEAYYNRGNAYALGKGMYDLAIVDYTKAIEINPKLANAYDNRGNTFKSKGELDKAISDYTKATEINPADADAYNNRGAVYYKKGQLDRAISDYNKALEIDQEYLEVYFNKAIACENAGRKKEAIEAYKAFIQYAPAQYAPYIERARQKIRDLGQ